MPKAPFGGVTVQTEPGDDGTGTALIESLDLSRMFLWTVSASISDAPRWPSRARDNWLGDFWRRPGNDILAGALATLNAKVCAANWFVDGPLTIAMAVRNTLLYQSQFGDGWDAMLQPLVMSFLDRDFGGILEQHRASASDHEGPALGYAHLDESKCYATGDWDYPLIYDAAKGPKKLHRSQFMRLVDCASSREKDKGVGFCAISRALVTALILMDIARYKRERLSDLPPAGILVINNFTYTEWEDITQTYDTRQRNEGNQVWRDVMTICGIDPRYPISIELFEMARLPEHYDERTATEIAVYTFALALRMDPREIWPVSAGPLGTATEAELQHRKAKAKGEGIIFTALERKLNGPNALPNTVRFKFDFREDEDDLRKAEIDGAKLRNIRAMWETSPNRGEPEGIITTDEARAWAVWENLIPPHIVGATITEGKQYDVRAYGPPARVHRDGRVLPLL